MTLWCLYVQAYGGYLATLLLSSDFPYLKCGTAVSPITDFELYGIKFSNIHTLYMMYCKWCSALFKRQLIFVFFCYRSLSVFRAISRLQDGFQSLFGKAFPPCFPPLHVCAWKCRSDGWSWRLMQFTCVSFSCRWRIWHRERASSRRSSIWSSTQLLMVTEPFHFSVWGHFTSECNADAVVTRLSNLSSPPQKRFTSSTRPNLSATWSARMPITLYRWAEPSPECSLTVILIILY